MEEIILIILSIFIVIVLIEELFRDFSKIKLIMYGVLLVVFLTVVKKYISDPATLYFNYISIGVLFAIPLLIFYYIIDDLISRKQNKDIEVK